MFLSTLCTETQALIANFFFMLQREIINTEQWPSVVNGIEFIHLGEFPVGYKSKNISITKSHEISGYLCNI